MLEKGFRIVSKEYINKLKSWSIQVDYDKSYHPKPMPDIVVVDRRQQGLFSSALINGCYTNCADITIITNLSFTSVAQIMSSALWQNLATIKMYIRSIPSEEAVKTLFETPCFPKLQSIHCTEKKGGYSEGT